MSYSIPQSVAKTIMLKTYLSDGATEAIGKCVFIAINKNAGSFVNPSGGLTTGTEIGQGWYSFSAQAGDIDTLGPLLVRGTGTGLDPTERLFYVVNPHNANFDGIPPYAAGVSGGLPLINANLEIPVSTLRINNDKSGYNVSGLNNPAYLDVLVSSRQPTGTDFSSLVNLDVPVSSRMPTGSFPTGVSFSFLDAPISSRMPTGTFAFIALGQPAVQILSALQGSIISVVKHDTLTLVFSNLGSLSVRSKLYFTVKSSPNDDDTKSLIQIEENGGLLYINGKVGNFTLGSLIVNDVNIGNLIVTLNASEMAKLPIGSYSYDIKIIRSVGISAITLTMNTFNIVSNSTWSIT